MIRRHFLTYFALCTISFAQPLLDLYGKNPTVFSAAKMSPLEVGLFIAIVLLAVPTIAICVDRISRVFGPRVNEATRLVLIGGMSFLLGWAVAQWLDIPGNVIPTLIALLFAVLVPKMFDTQKSFRELTRWMALVSIPVLVIAVSQLQPVLMPTDGPRTDAVIGKKGVTVLQFVFDEFPLYPLLGADGNINAERWPGFAQLAASSTWFRNSVAESNFTHQAVPAILASVVPKQEGGPFLAQYPKNIFTLYSGVTKVGAIEPVTSLCPHKTCGTSVGSTFAFSTTRLMHSLRDAFYVYGHRVFPPRLRDQLPSIEGAWGGFGAVANRFRDSFDVGAMSQPNAIERGIDTLINDPSPRVQVIHALLPHAPWRLTPDGRVAPLSPAISTTNPMSEDGIRDTYQTFLMQLGALDAEVSKAISHLKQAGRFDNTMIVVTADHGISFLPGKPQRHSELKDKGQQNDVYRIPTFIKFPGQTSGAVSDCPISNLDVLPTIIDVTQTKTSWKFAGQSVAGECPQGRTRSVVSATGQRGTMQEGFEVMAKRIEHYAGVVSNIGPLTKVSAVGASASLIGQPITSQVTDTVVQNWILNNKQRFAKVSDTRGSLVPSVITGNIQVTQQLPIGTEGIVAIDGIAAGVIGEMSGGVNHMFFTSVLDYSLLKDGAHSVELFVRSPEGVITKVGAPL